MADLKPLGSEKLQGDEKLKRILELTYYKADSNSNTKPANAEHISESINGVYGIVKEKDGYYVKKGLTENTLDYIGGMFMKNKNRFHSYNEALKRLELLKGQELLLQEDTKYMLKVNKGKPATPSSAEEGIPPAPVPSDSAPISPPTPEAGAETATAPEETPELPTDDMGDEDEGGDFLKGIQKLTGKLGEKLRDHMDEMESDDLKYVLNSVISAIDLSKLDDGDKDEVVSQLEGDEEEGGDMGGENMPPETGDMGGETPPAPTSDEELSEVDDLEELINTSFDFNDDESKPYEGEVDELLTVTPSDEEVGDEELPHDSADDFDNEEDLPEPTDDTEEDMDVCEHCKGTGIYRGKECTVCNGEGVVAPDTETNAGIIPDANIPLSAEDLYDDDPGYDPTEMGEEYTGEEVYDGPDMGDIKMKEIELNELTDMIHNTVKETLGKYFE